MRLDGYDISHHNLITAWDQLPWFPVVMHKACEGDHYVDPLCASRLPLLKARIKGVYMWLRPDATPDAQVGNFQRQIAALSLIDTAGHLKPGYILMVDWERTGILPFPTLDQVTAVHDLLHGLYGDRIITYSAAWVAGFIQWRAAHPDAPVWYADYSATGPATAAHYNAVCHQYTDRAVIPGFASPVDGNTILRQDVLDRIAGLETIEFPSAPQGDEDMRTLCNGEIRTIQGHPWSPGQVVYKFKDDDTTEHVTRPEVVVALGGSASDANVNLAKFTPVGNAYLDALGAA